MERYSALGSVGDDLLGLSDHRRADGERVVDLVQFKQLLGALCAKARGYSARWSSLWRWLLSQWMRCAVVRTWRRH